MFSISSIRVGCNNSHTSIPKAPHTISSVLRLSVPLVSNRLTVHGPGKEQRLASVCWVQPRCCRRDRIFDPIGFISITYLFLGFSAVLLCVDCDCSLPQKDLGVYVLWCISHGFSSSLLFSAASVRSLLPKAVGTVYSNWKQS